MLDLTINPLPELASKTTSYPITQTIKCESKISSTITKESLNNPETPKENRHEKRSKEHVSDTHSYSTPSLISPALFTRPFSFVKTPTSSPSQEKPSQSFSSLRTTMNENILQSRQDCRITGETMTRDNLILRLLPVPSG